LTGVRGVAALHVMMFHYLPGLPYSNPVLTFVAHGYLEVDLFFVLSGFVMALNYSRMFEARWSALGYLTFLGRRIARVYPLYLVTTVCALALAVSGVIDLPRLTSLKTTFILNLFMIQSWGLAESLNPPAWSISSEWAAYLLFPPLVVACLFRRPALAWTFGVVCVVALGVLSQVPVSWGHQFRPNSPLDLSDPRFAFPVLRCLSEFCLGIIAFRMMNSSLGPVIAGKRWVTYAICTSWIVLMAVPGADLAVVLLLPFLVISITSERHWAGKLLASRPFEFAGQLSYSIYLIHALMRGIIGRLHERIEGLGFQHAQTYAACCAAAITFFLSYLAYYAVEIPGRRWFRRVFEGGQRPAVVPEPSAP
jgi:peptidoglycan/LPS O-acetylase OafA/YrhL